MSDERICRRCQQPLGERPTRYSKASWQARQYCSDICRGKDRGDATAALIAQRNSRAHVYRERKAQYEATRKANQVKVHLTGKLIPYLKEASVRRAMSVDDFLLELVECHRMEQRMATRLPHGAQTALRHESEAYPVHIPQRGMKVY